MQRSAPAASSQQGEAREHHELRRQPGEQPGQPVAQARQEQGAPARALEADSGLQRRPRVLLAASGSVATVKLAQLAELLLQVCVAASRSAAAALFVACCVGVVLRCPAFCLHLRAT